MSLLSAKNLYSVASCKVVEYSVKYNVTMHRVVNALLQMAKQQVNQYGRIFVKGCPNRAVKTEIVYEHSCTIDL